MGYKALMSFLELTGFLYKPLFHHSILPGFIGVGIGIGIGVEKVLGSSLDTDPDSDPDPDGKRAGRMIC